jgi:hypothetical protein
LYLNCLMYFNEIVLIHSRSTTFRRSNLVEWRPIRKKRWRLLFRAGSTLVPLSNFYRSKLTQNTSRGHLVTAHCVFALITLKDLRCRWIEAQQLTSSKERRGTTTRCYVLLTKALYICDKFEDSGFDKSLHLILLSVRVLLCSLAITTKTIARSEVEASSLSSLLSSIRFRSTPHSDPDRYWPLLMPHMLRNGWW